jgi:zinc/manganese transport system ATP-binding protein
MGDAMMPPAIRVENLTLCYDRQAAVSGLSGCFAPGSLTAIAGPNGAGKTTLLRALAGLHPPAAGRIDVAKDQVALLPQASTLDRSFPISCLEMVALGHWARLGPFRRQTPAMRDAVRQALVAVGLSDLAARPVGSLSAGQFQRALFARLIVQDAPILLLDEPFTAVDERTAADLLDLVQGWHAAGRTVIAVLHDLYLIQRAFPETLLLAGEAIAWGPSAVCLTPANIRRARLGMEGWNAPAVPDRPALRRPAA